MLNTKAHYLDQAITVKKLINTDGIVNFIYRTFCFVLE